MVALITFVIGLTSASILNVFRFKTATDSAAEQEIRQLEREYIEAHLNRDTARLDSLLADEFTIRDRCRTITNKAQRLALLEDSDSAFVDIEIYGSQVEVNGESATVTGSAAVEGRHSGREFFTPRYRFTRLYEKREGHWQIVSVRVSR
jgi:ketosteroid isomerase-like protein